MKSVRARRSLGNFLQNFLCIFLFSALTCSATPISNSRMLVASQGVTDVTATFGKTQVSVKITTHELETESSSNERSKIVFSSCTHSRIPCSLVDYVEISINGNTLFVARSVYADLADVGEARLHRSKSGMYVLTLVGGDASESYTVEITFNGSLVKQRTLTSNESGAMMQKTVYFSSPAMNY
jgi:hypothetical protein